MCKIEIVTYAIALIALIYMASSGKMNRDAFAVFVTDIAIFIWLPLWLLNKVIEKSIEYLDSRYF